MKNQLSTSTEANDFLDYVMTFYGEGGIYPFFAEENPLTKLEVASVLIPILNDEEKKGTDYFSGNFDTCCREVIRDILLYNRGERDLEHLAFITKKYKKYLVK
jgi:hypothetical protein